MKSLLRILHLEDDLNDATLVQATLEGGGVACAITRVQTREDFVLALERGGIDLILSDYTLPTFDGLAAAKIAHTQWPTIPLIFVSGTLGEERAIDALKSGATDYVLKGRLARLAPAVQRAMLEVAASAERRRLEAQFIEGQKMDVVGQLVGGVAHDFNNMLAVIIGCGDMIKIKLGPDSPLQKYTDNIRHASERAAGLTRQLLVFIRKETVQPIVLDLNEVVRELEGMLRPLVDERIEMVVLPGRRRGRVKADSGQIGQVLMNLVINARDAMPKGGKLTIATHNVSLDESEAHAHSQAAPGPYVMLSVSDTGTGMTDEVKAHLFEAFFTTKPLGKGTGMGLATCQAIAKQSGGHIDVSSKAGQGTTFKVYFPRVEQPLHPASKSVEPWPMPRGSETLLVVEDEPSVRHLACELLEGQGYTVLPASNGHEALHKVRAHRGSPISLVVTDVIMPLMGGQAMAGLLKTAMPDLKILFTSGYTDEALTENGAIELGSAFLPKPFTPAGLTHKVRELLDAN